MRGGRQRARTARLVQIQIRWTEGEEGDVCTGACVCKCEKEDGRANTYDFRKVTGEESELLLMLARRTRMKRQKQNQR